MFCQLILVPNRIDFVFSLLFLLIVANLIFILQIPEEYYKSNQWQRLTIFWRTKALADVWHEKILFTIVDSLEVIKDLKNWTSYEFKVAAVVANVTVASEIRSVLVKGAGMVFNFNEIFA